MWLTRLTRSYRRWWEEGSSAIDVATVALAKIITAAMMFLPPLPLLLPLAPVNTFGN